MPALVEAVALDDLHRFSKRVSGQISLVTGLGVAGDAHAGRTVQHRSRIAQDPGQPNLRQVHLIHAELFDALGDAGYAIAPGDLGENVTTRGIDLLALSAGARLCLGVSAEIEVTGLRNPCAQIEAFRPGLLAQVMERRDGRLVRKSGIMAIVLRGGPVRRGDAIRISHRPDPHVPLDRV